MSPTLKRKGSPGIEDAEESAKRRFAESDEVKGESVREENNPDAPSSFTVAPDATSKETVATPPSAETSATTPAASNDRLARFAALRARNQAGRKSNLQETKSEAQRASTDLSQLTALIRKKEIAAHKLLKAEIEDGGEDFERKRAWDWTVEESERWDARQAEKEKNRANNKFAGYSEDAEKVYSRQISNIERRKGGTMEERREEYEREKAAAIERAVQSGGLELVETSNGELIAVDKDGSFYSTAGAADDPHTAMAKSKPSRAAVDRLVDDIKKAEEVRLKRRRDRGLRDDEAGGDINYINAKNKEFNLKLARFYNKYTADIRESFERGTAI